MVVQKVGGLMHMALILTDEECEQAYLAVDFEIELSGLLQRFKESQQKRNAREKRFEKIKEEFETVQDLIREHLDETCLDEDSSSMQELRKMFWSDSDSEKWDIMARQQG